jgi:hypothetical protein
MVASQNDRFARRHAFSPEADGRKTRTSAKLSGVYHLRSPASKKKYDAIDGIDTYLNVSLHGKNTNDIAEGICEVENSFFLFKKIVNDVHRRTTFYCESQNIHKSQDSHSLHTCAG